MRLVLCRLGAALLLTGLAACDSTDATTADEARRVHGAVRDATSGNKLKGASVRFLSDTLDTKNERTDSDGEYSFLVATDTKHGRIEATKSGYEPRTVSVFFDSDDVQIDIELNRGTTAAGE